jgi:ribosome-binding protein aMBF1 (putative translation factor)
MSAHTRTHLTKHPIKRRPKEEKSLPWEAAYKKDIKKYGEAGIALRGIRAREGLTQKQLGERIGVSQNHISEMENKKRPIGKAMAKRLEKEFKVSYKVFL